MPRMSDKSRSSEDLPKASAGKKSAPTSGKREQILQAATRVFLEHGYEGTSMDRVAAESGSARRTLYNQFESKELLFDAMTERIWTSFPVLDITRDEESLQNPKIGLVRLGHAIADFWVPAESVAFLRMVIAEGPRFPGLTRTFVEKGKGPAMKAVVDYLEALVKRKLVTIKNPQIAGRQFLGLIDEPLLWVRVVGIDERYTKSERQYIVESAVEMFLGLYSVKATPKSRRAVAAA